EGSPDHSSRLAAAPAEGYVKEFTRHSNDVLLNLNELRHRNILTDTTLVVSNVQLRAHCAVLVACSGFFYSLYSHHVLLQGRGSSGEQLMTVSLPDILDPSSIALLLDFMYTSRLPLTPSIAPGVLTAATYLQMDHVADTCRDFMKLGNRASVEKYQSSGLTVFSLFLQSDVKASPDPKACNWKKYKYIVLNPLCATATVKEEEMEEPQNQSSPTADRMGSAPSAPTEVKTTPPSHCRILSVLSFVSLTLYHFPKPAESARQHAVKRENYYVPYCYSGNLQGTKTVCSGEPYRCNVCGAQFNRPANLKTHSRIHSGEKPYRCDTCGARFVQVAHLRAHVLIHTGEKPYPCHTCGTRFRHLQTLKSHLRIHTGEKPYTCEKCDLHFRHKSQLRLHLRQKHGAVTNTKIRYKVLTEPYQPIL
uniref:Uncharacterized protein n=1 Tax=Mola mola TaxID=94237 RepID=A0A3Q4BCN2_MOLML